MSFHYNDLDIEVSTAFYEVIFTNKITGKQIRMKIPRLGAFEDPKRRITRDEVEKLAHKVSHLLRRHLV